MAKTSQENVTTFTVVYVFLRGFFVVKNLMNITSSNNLIDEQFEINKNLSAFFGLLLNIDKRVNPHNYKYENENNLCKAIQNQGF